MMRFIKVNSKGGETPPQQKSKGGKISFKE